MLSVGANKLAAVTTAETPTTSSPTPHARRPLILLRGGFSGVDRSLFSRDVIGRQ